jgi:hypothetical protein
VTSIVPAGYEAYARILHPAETPVHGAKLVRWREVSAWSGLPLRSDSQFYAIALPMIAPALPAPWRGQGPSKGALYPPDAAALAELLRPHTSTPEQCWFGIWDGYGWESIHRLTSHEEGSTVLPDPIPAPVRYGPRVRLPNRDYLLYSGSVESAMESVALADMGQTPNLWWPEDRSWFVASEIDLAWSYVGGSHTLIEMLVSNDRIEAQAIQPTDDPWHEEEWLQEMVAKVVNDLLEDQNATVATPRGTVSAFFQPPTRLHAGELRISSVFADGGRGTGRTPLRSRDPEVIRTNLIFQLTGSVVQLVGG